MFSQRFLSLFLCASAAIYALAAPAAPSGVEIANTPLVVDTRTDSPRPANGTVQQAGPSIQAVGGYSRSCTWWGGTYGNAGGRGVAVLQATCGNGRGGSVTSSIDLNQCLANRGGNIACVTNNGGFGGSCQVTNSLGTGNTYLQMICGNGSGGYNRISYNVDVCVGNLGGYLRC